MITRAAERVGSQSVVVTLDYKQSPLLKKLEIFTHNGTVNTNLHPLEFALRAESLGAGEIIFNSINKDGTATNFDLRLADRIRPRFLFQLRYWAAVLQQKILLNYS